MKKSKLLLPILHKKRLLIVLLIAIFLTSGPVLAESESQPVEVKIESKVLDKRAEILGSYLSQYNSPLAYHAGDFVEAADQYYLDWKLVAAISGVESTFGKHIPGGYNAWGWGVYGDQAIYFKSWRDGIFTVSEGLRKNYFDKGLNNPYELNRIYAASPTWGAHVSYFLADMEKYEQEYRKDRDLADGKNLNFQTAGTSAILAVN